MTIEHTLAVLAVRDISAALDYYSALFGRAPDNNPMPDLIEWQLTDSGWLQVHTNAATAGNGQFNLAVDDLAKQRAELLDRGLAPGEIEQVNKGVELCPITDPDGNIITFVGNFRVVY